MNRLSMAFFLMVILCVAMWNIYATELASTTEWTVLDRMVDNAAANNANSNINPKVFQFPHNFEQSDRAPANQRLTFTVAIKPKDIQNFVLSLADPTSANYQKEVTNQEIDRLTANPEGSKIVSDYLKSQGMEIENASPTGDFISASATVDTWERALNTQFHVYRNTVNTRDALIRTKVYSFPAEIAPHVTGVLNMVEFPSPLGAGSRQRADDIAHVKRVVGQDQSVSLLVGKRADLNTLSTDTDDSPTNAPSAPPFITLAPDTVVDPIRKK